MIDYHRLYKDSQRHCNYADFLLCNVFLLLLTALNGNSETGVPSLAASLELRSQHPLARAILECALAYGLQAQAPKDFSSLTGTGARGRIHDETVYIGSPGLFNDFDVALDETRKKIENLQRESKTVVLVGT